jgi:hypothetical protein
MSVTNSGQKVTNALLTLHYDNGQKKYEMQQTVQPGDQMWVDFAQLIRNRVPDRKGNVLPADAAFGTYDLRDLSPGLGSLSQGNLTLDSTFGFNAKPVYANCCGTYGAEFGVASFDLAVDDESLAPVDGTDECNGDQEDISADFDGRWSANSAIATVAPEEVTGVSAGTTTASASGDVLEGDGGYCALEPVQVNAPVTVQVPTSLSVVNVTVLPNGQDAPHGCGGLANYGIMVDIKYRVLDQNTQPIQSANMTPHENGTGFGGASYSNNIGPVSGYPTSSATTASDGTFHDVPFGGCANGAFSSFTATQNITIIMPNGSSPAVRSQTFNLTGATAGHGTLTNSITSPGSGSDISATR